MKIRDSGMPEQELWDRFFDASLIFERLDIPSGRSAAVVDFGCGYGSFTVAMAARTGGTIYALDIDPAMISATVDRARHSGVSNVQALQRDFIADGSGLPDRSVDCVLLFNILHADEPLRLLCEAHRILRTEGVVAIMHWIADATTPRGPPLNIRPRPEQCAAWATAAGFELRTAAVSLPPFHYGLVAHKLG
jgi:SAM-dependent methyltransferase